MDNQEKNRSNDRRANNWRWESDEVGKRPKTKSNKRQNLKQLIKSGRFDADELYEDE